MSESPFAVKTGSFDADKINQFKELANPWEISFEYQGHTFKAVHTLVTKLGRIPTTKVDHNPWANISIFDEKGNRHGEIIGNYFSEGYGGKLAFRSARMDNDTLNYSTHSDSVIKNPDRISGVVRESVVQMLLQNKIDLWISSRTHLAGGKIVYERLLKDPRVHVEIKNEYPQGDYPEYRISKLH